MDGRVRSGKWEVRSERWEVKVAAMDGRVKVKVKMKVDPFFVARRREPL
jgi:hypothetical protein